MQKEQTRLDESEKKMGLMDTTLQTLIKDIVNESCEKRHNRGWEGDKRKEEEDEKSTP